MRLLRNGAMALAIAGVALTATSATADDRGGPGYYGKPYPSSWQGSYAGVNAGFGELDGGFIGGQIGHNWQNGKIVYGIEGDFQLSNMEEDFNRFGVNASFSIDWFATVRGRAGYLVDPNILLYGTAGFAIVSFSFDSNIPNFRDDGTETDLVVGVGIEGKINETMTGRLELLSSDELDGEIIRAGLNFKLGR
jgi:outer membrane immunogenic protein